VITCGGLQSNHARATALLARRLGLKAILLLRTPEPLPPAPVGNWFLDTLAGADLRFISPAQYADRNALMQQLADECAGLGERAYVIVEGGSSALGCLGYVDAMREVRAQLDANEALPDAFDAVVHACGSGGTAAGVALGASRWNVAPRAYAMAVCVDRAYFTELVGMLMEVTRTLDSSLGPPCEGVFVDAWKGPAYGVASNEQRAFIAAVARTCGLILDPVYSGKALFALSKLPTKPARALFIHTGGLHGLLADAAQFFSSTP
jgi:D-cysteine desulfhydrase